MKVFRKHIKNIVTYFGMLVILKLLWNCHYQQITPTTVNTKPEKIVIYKYLNCTSSPTKLAPAKQGRTQVEHYKVGIEPTENIVEYFNSVFDRGLLVDWWLDLCFSRTTWERTWHPLFPAIPQKTTTIFIAGDKERTVGNFLRRAHGFLYTNQSNHYEFELLSRDGAEAMLMDTGVMLGNEENLTLSTLQKAKEMLYLSLTKEQMDEQDSKIPLSQMFSTKPSKKVWLESQRLYFVEIVQGGKHFVKFQLRWRITGVSDSHSASKNFTVPTHDNLLHTRIPFYYSKIHERSKQVENYPALKEEQLRNDFYKIPVLDTTDLIYSPSASKNYVCERTERKPIEIKSLYEGYWKHVESFVSYPKEYFQYVGQTKSYHILLDEKAAFNVVNKTFEKLNEIYNG